MIFLITDWLNFNRVLARHDCSLVSFEGGNASEAGAITAYQQGSQWQH